MYWRRALSPGFALPTIIVVSVILFAVLAAVMSTVSSVRSRLTDQYRQSLTRDAAESGVAYASYCYASQAGTLDATEWPLATDGAGQTLTRAIIVTVSPIQPLTAVRQANHRSAT